MSENVVNKSNDLMKVSDAKKVVKSAFEQEFLTPFKCLIWSNKNKSKSGFSDLYQRYNIVDESGKIRNLKLDDLLNILPDGETEDEKRVFCKLSSSDAKGLAISTFVDKNEKIWYYIPIKYSTNDFFASVAAKQSLTNKERTLQAWNENEEARKKAEKAKREKLQKKINELKESDNYKGLSDAQIEIIARDITNVRLSL